MGEQRRTEMLTKEEKKSTVYIHDVEDDTNCPREHSQLWDVRANVHPKKQHIEQQRRMYNQIKMDQEQQNILLYSTVTYGLGSERFLTCANLKSTRVTKKIISNRATSSSLLYKQFLGVANIFATPLDLSFIESQDFQQSW